MAQRDVSPEHQLPLVWIKDFTHTPEMFEIDRAYTFRFHNLAALSFAKLERFVCADVKESSGEEFVQFTIPVSDELVCSLLLRREHVAVGRLGKLGVLFNLERVVQVAEGLLFRDEFDVIAARVHDKLT